MAVGLKLAVAVFLAYTACVCLQGNMAEKDELLSRCENLTANCDATQEDICVYTFLLPRDGQKGCTGFRRSIMILREQDKEITALQETAQQCLATLAQQGAQIGELTEYKDLTEYQDRKQIRRLQRQQERWEEEMFRQQHIIEIQQDDIEHLSIEKSRQEREIDKLNQRIDSLEQMLVSQEKDGVSAPTTVAMDTHPSATAIAAADPDAFMERVLNLTVSDPIRSITLFEIHCVTYIAYVTINGTDILVLDNNTVTPFQHIDTDPGDINFNGLTFFKMERQHFLTVTNCRLGNHCIYRWENGTFAEFQVIFLNGVHSWSLDYFHTSTSQGRKHFLAVASFSKFDSRFNSNEHDIDSVIFVWNGERFVIFQPIPTSGARDVSSVTIGNYVYVCFANSFSGKVWPRYKVYSEVYKMSASGFSFGRHQLLPTAGASAAVVTFHFGGETYLVDVMWQGVYGSLLTDTPIYVWDGDGQQFVERQTIQTLNARMACPFTIQNQIYLAVTNGGNSMTDPFLVIYTRAKTGPNFVEKHRIRATHGKHCAVHQKDDTTYLIIDQAVYVHMK